MSTEERRKRLLGLGMTADEVDRHLAVTAGLGATGFATGGVEKALDSALAEVVTAADTGNALDWAKRLETEPTTLCKSHVGTPEDPWTCRHCGKPFSEIARELVFDEARSSERRAFADDEWEDVTAAEDAPLCAVLTPAEVAAILTPADLAAILDGPEDAPALPIIERPENPRPGTGWDVVMVAVKPVFHGHLRTMATAANMSVEAYVEKLIKQQWIASGAGKRA